MKMHLLCVAVRTSGVAATDHSVFMELLVFAQPTISPSIPYPTHVSARPCELITSSNRHCNTVDLLSLALHVCVAFSCLVDGRYFKNRVRNTLQGGTEVPKHCSSVTKFVMGLRNSVAGLGTALQAGESRV